MSTIGQTNHTLLDHAKMLGPDGQYQQVIEMLSQNNDVLQDAVYLESNKDTSHVHTIRTGLPTTYWKRLGKGVLASKGLTAQVEDACAMIESWSIVEKDLADLGGNPAKYRMNHASAHLESMGQQIASTMFYGSAATPEEFIGLAPRYSSLSAANKDNIVDCGGVTSSNTSVWLVGWGENSVHGIFQKGTKAGINRVDYGEQVEQSFGGVSGAQAVVYKEQFQAKTGLAVGDWRYAARGCNIDVNNLKTKTNAVDLMEMMIKLVYQIPNDGKGVKLSFYMNRTVQKFLDIQGRDTVIAGAGITFENVNGQRQLMFRGIPIGRCDALVNTESQVT